MKHISMKQIGLPGLGHNCFVHVKDLNSYTDWKICTVCDEIYALQEVVNGKISINRIKDLRVA